MVRMTLEEIMASRPRVDRAKIDATSEEDIVRHMREDDNIPGEMPETFRPERESR